VDRLTVTPPDLVADALGAFRWGRVAGKVLVTNDAGDWMLLSDPEFADLLGGRIGEGHARFADLQRKGFLREGLDLDALITRVAQRNKHLRRDAAVHVLNLTANRHGDVVEMSAETAEQIVGFALDGLSQTVCFEFQADDGEPLLAFELLRHIVEVARSRNQRAAGKTLRFAALTNFSQLTDTVAEWLLANDVLIGTSLDGPAALHDATRAWKGGSPHAEVVGWIDDLHRRYATLGRDASQWRVDARLTVSRDTLSLGREIVDEYLAHGLRTLHLRPLDRAVVGAENWARVGYDLDDYLAFYRHTLDYLLDCNRRGSDIRERKAAVVLTRMLTATDAGVTDMQSPHGGGSAEFAYDVEGRAFPGDEARLVDALGDPFLLLGHVTELTPETLGTHHTTRAIAAASLLDVQPMCADCWNKPFCGYSPVRTFITQGDLAGQRPDGVEHREHLAIATRLFELLDGADAELSAILARWASPDPRLAAELRTAKPAP
jgi:sulfatase maturation enzyme AslB (radical SAM superfamily)